MDLFSIRLNKKGPDLVPYILSSLDDDALRAFNTFPLTEEQQKDPKEIYSCFETLLDISKPNFRAARLDYFYLR